MHLRQLAICSELAFFFGEIKVMNRRSYTEIGVAAFIIIICAVFIVQAVKLPPGSFEPLGSGPVPIYTSVIIILCCAIVIVRSTLTLLQSSNLKHELKVEFSGGSPLGSVLMLVLSVLYVGLLHLKILSFGVVTFGFLALLIWSMERFNRKKLPLIILIAAIFSFGAEYIFTNIFVVDLPT